MDFLARWPCAIRGKNRSLAQRVHLDDARVGYADFLNVERDFSPTFDEMAEMYKL